MPRCSWIKAIVTRDPSATTVATYAEAVRKLTALAPRALKGDAYSAKFAIRPSNDFL